MKAEQSVTLNRTERSYKTKKMTIMAVITAFAYVVVFFLRIPIFQFLSLEFKDTILTIGAFIFGPLEGLIMVTIVCIVEMFTIGTTGIIGCIMNVLASASFVCIASLIYKIKPSLKFAVIGVTAATLSMTVVMIAWNYFVTPYYMNVPTSAVVNMLIPIFLPFNLLKGGLNAGIAIMLFPLISVLEKANLIPKKELKQKENKAVNIGLIILVALALITCVIFVLKIKNVF